MVSRSKRPKQKRIVTEEIIDVTPEPEHATVIDPPEVFDEEELAFEREVREFGEHGLVLNYYEVRPGGNAFIGSYDHKIPEAQIQEWYPQGIKVQVKMIVGGELRRIYYQNIAGRPGAQQQSQSSPFNETLSRMERIMERMATPREGAPVGELASALVALHGLMPKPEPVNFQQQLQQSIELAKLIKGIPDEDTSLGGTVKEVLKSVGPGIVQGLMMGGARPVNGNGAHHPELPVMDPIKSGLEFLKKKALAGANPDLYVWLACDNAEHELYGPIVRTILDPKTDFSVFVQQDAQIGQPPYDKFFRSIFDGVRRAFSETDTVDADTAGPSGNTGNASNDATPREGTKRTG